MNFRSDRGTAPFDRQAVADVSEEFVIFFMVEETFILGFLNPTNEESKILRNLIYQYLPINKMPNNRIFKFSATELCEP
jgi:hypothetical protein